MKRNVNSVGYGLIAKATFFLLLLGATNSHSSFASPTDPKLLDVKMTLATKAHISLGEPIVVHYTLNNMADVGQVTFHSGEKDNEWYMFTLIDAGGHTVTAKPLALPAESQGFHPSPERSIRHGEEVQGNLVVTQYLAVPRPGIYTLRVHASAPYYIEPDGAAWYPQGRPDNMTRVNFAQNFDFPLTVTTAQPALLRTVAETLGRQFADVRFSKQRDVIAAELFSLPEAEALPTWQALVNNPATDDFMLADAAEPLSLRPSRASAELVAQMLWEKGQETSTRYPSQIGRLREAMSKMYETASPGLRPYVRSLYIAHGVPASEVDHPAVKSDPN